MLSSFQWCFAINNIDYVQQSIQAFVGELGMEEIVTSLANFRSQTEADHCQRTLHLVIDNAVDTVGNKILELLEKVAEKVGNLSLMTAHNCHYSLISTSITLTYLKLEP